MVVFYALAGVLALATALNLVRPLLARGPETETRDNRDTQLYRDQLGEVERDLTRGAISTSEAEGAKAEVSRRLIAAAGRAETDFAHGPAPRGRSRLLAGLALIGAPALAIAIYLANGVPGLPDLPFVKRAAIEAAPNNETTRPSQAEAEASFTPEPPTLTEDQKSYADLTEQLEATLEQRPNDAQGLELLATGYMRLQRYRDSWRTLERLIVIYGDEANAGLYASMAEAMVLATGGYVSPEAEQAIGAALVRDQTLPMARYYLGLQQAQAGHIAKAIAIWERLKTETPADAPWLDFLDALLANAKGQRSVAPGPSAADIEAAGSMSAEERQEMIKGMVGQLEERLTSQGGEPEEWLRLMNAYVQLDRSDDAARVARLGIASFGNRAEAGFLRERALVMGLAIE